MLLHLVGFLLTQHGLLNHKHCRLNSPLINSGIEDYFYLLVCALYVFFLVNRILFGVARVVYKELVQRQTNVLFYDLCLQYFT